MALDPLSASQMTGAAGALGIFAALGAFFIVVWIALYIYSSLAMMHTAQRLRTQPAWLAWIPIARNALMPKMVKMPWWPVLLLVGSLIFFWVPPLAWILSIAFYVFYIIWLWKICEVRKFPGWIAVLIIVPFLGQIWLFVLWGLLAWSK